MPGVTVDLANFSGIELDALQDGLDPGEHFVRRGASGFALEMAEFAANRAEAIPVVADDLGGWELAMLEDLEGDPVTGDEGTLGIPEILTSQFQFHRGALLAPRRVDVAEAGRRGLADR